MSSTKKTLSANICNSSTKESKSYIQQMLNKSHSPIICKSLAKQMQVIGKKNASHQPKIAIHGQTYRVKTCKKNVRWCTQYKLKLYSG